MATLIDMQMGAEETAEQISPTPADAPKYPWGLCITLNDDSLEKLGVKTLPAVDTEVTIVAKAVVSATRENQRGARDSWRLVRDSVDRCAATRSRSGLCGEDG